MDFHPMKAPDYGKQVDATGTRAPVGDIFSDPNKQPAYDKQGDPIPGGTMPVPEFHDGTTQEERGRVPREVSGATSARSGSVSRSRDRRVIDVSMGFNPDSNFRGGASNGNASGRNASMSPTRAMGARSVSIERIGMYRQKSRLDTLEGIGSSVDTSVVNPDALDNATSVGGGGVSQERGRPTGIGGVDAVEERGRNPSTSSAAAAAQRVLSPHRAMGARSVSAVRVAIPEARAEEEEEDRGRGGAGTQSAAAQRVVSPHRAMGARSVSAVRVAIPEKENECEDRGRGANMTPSQRVLSPHRAMGARSVSAVRVAIPEKEPEEEQRGRDVGSTTASQRVLSPHRAMGARSVSAVRVQNPEAGQ